MCGSRISNASAYSDRFSAALSNRASSEAMRLGGTENSALGGEGHRRAGTHAFAPSRRGALFLSVRPQADRSGRLSEGHAHADPLEMRSVQKPVEDDLLDQMHRVEAQSHSVQIPPQRAAATQLLEISESNASLALQQPAVQQPPLQVQQQPANSNAALNPVGQKYQDARLQKMHERVQTSKKNLEEIRDKSAQSLRQAQAAGVHPARRSFWKKIGGLAVTAVAIGLGLSGVVTMGLAPLVVLGVVALKTGLDAIAAGKHLKEAVQKANGQSCANNFPTGDFFTDMAFRFITRGQDRSAIGQDAPQMQKARKWGKGLNVAFSIGCIAGVGVTGLVSNTGLANTIAHASAMAVKLALVTWGAASKSEAPGRTDRALANLAESYMGYFEQLERTLESVDERARSAPGDAGHLDDEEVDKKLQALQASLDDLAEKSSVMEANIHKRLEVLNQDAQSVWFGRGAGEGLTSSVVEGVISFTGAAFLMDAFSDSIGQDLVDQLAPASNTADDLVAMFGGIALASAMRKVRSRQLVDPGRAALMDPRALALHQEMDNLQKRQAAGQRLAPQAAPAAGNPAPFQP